MNDPVIPRRLESESAPVAAEPGPQFVQPAPLTDGKEKAGIFVHAAGIMSLVTGAAGVLGWGQDIPVLISLAPGLEPMKLDTAFGLMLGGIALLLLARRRVARAGRLFAVVCATGMVVLAALAIGGYASSVPVHGLFFGEAMPPNSAMAVLLGGAALFAIAARQTSPVATAMAAGFGGLVVCIGMVALAGHGMGVAAGYRWGNLPGMAVHSAIGFLLLGSGLTALAAHHQRWQWTFSREIVVCFAAGIALLLAVSAFTYRTLHVFATTSAEVATMRQAQAEAGGLQREIAEAATVRRTYAEQGRAAEGRSAYRTSVRQARAHLANLDRLTRDQPPQRAHVVALENLIGAGLARAIAPSPAGPPPTAGEARAGANGTAELIRLLSALDDELTRAIRDREEVTRRQFDRAVLAVPTGTIGSIFLLTVALVLLNRESGERQRTLAHLGLAEQQIRRLNEDLEQRIRQRTAELEAANKELESFSYSVSHDLRAPLRHVQGYVTLLQRATGGQLPAKAERYLQVINDASVEMGRLIDDLLEFSRMGRVQLAERTVGLDPLVQEVLTVLEPAMQGRKIAWEIGALPAVLGDRAMLRQVVANLLSNALKYSRGRDPARIEIGCAGDEDGRIILRVRDNGAGFDMQYVHKLFGVFQRLHRADEFEGTGIGLATVARIIARHGGRIWADGAVGQGASFYFTLRRAPTSSREPVSQS